MGIPRAPATTLQGHGNSSSASFDPASWDRAPNRSPKLKNLFLGPAGHTRQSLPLHLDRALVGCNSMAEAQSCAQNPKKPETQFSGDIPMLSFASRCGLLLGRSTRIENMSADLFIFGFVMDLFVTLEMQVKHPPWGSNPRPQG